MFYFTPTFPLISRNTPLNVHAKSLLQPTHNSVRILTRTGLAAEISRDMFPLCQSIENGLFNPIGMVRQRHVT